jgi:SAM-dependent methyltransferase
MPDAQEWEQSALSKRPWRTEFFARFSSELQASEVPVRRVLELGSGPGFLADQLLSAHPHLSYTLLDFSTAMNQLAAARLGEQGRSAQFVERSLRDANWSAGLGPFECVVTNQAVHELRHKRHAPLLHRQVREVLAPGGSYLVCDHYFGDDGMKNDQLYMSIPEQRAALAAAGFRSVVEVLTKGGLVLHRATR